MEVDVVIEIPQGSQNKYEVDHKTGRVRLDRVLYSPVHYPTEYGFVDETLSEDGDPIDVLVLATFPTFPGCVMRARIIGLLEMVDDKGIDNKLLAVAADDPRFDHIQSLTDVPAHRLKEIAHFFEHYKELENKAVQIGGWKDAQAALAVLEDCIARYRSHPH